MTTDTTPTPARPDEGTVDVTGTGAVTVPPTHLQVDLGLEVSRPTPGAALTAVSELSGALVALLDRHGIAAADRTTIGLSVNPEWDHRGPEPHLRGHQAGYQLRFRTADLPTARAVLDDAGAAEPFGQALRVNGIHWLQDDREEHLAEARRLAVGDATARARVLAEAAGVRLGPLRLLTDQPVGRGERVMDWMAQPMAARASGPAIEAGEQQVAASVRMVFAIDR